MFWLGSLANSFMSLFEARLEKTYHQGFQPGQTLPHTSILSVIEFSLKFRIKLIITYQRNIKAGISLYGCTAALRIYVYFDIDEVAAFVLTRPII